MREIAELAARVAELERRVAGTMRHGRVAEVDPAEAWVRLDFGAATGGGRFLSPKVPYAQIAGALKVHTPPSVGQQMTVVAPAGDWQQAVAVPMTWSNQNNAPSDSGDEHVLTYGDWRITLRDNLLKFECGELTIEKTDGGMTLSVGGTRWSFTGAGLTQTGGQIDHDGHRIDKTHRHTETATGPSLSGPPQ